MVRAVQPEVRTAQHEGLEPAAEGCRPMTATWQGLAAAVGTIPKLDGARCRNRHAEWVDIDDIQRAIHECHA